jgi:hypothetical protein
VVTLFPFTALIRYQDVPASALPRHVVVQLPPVTLVTTVTWVSVPTRAFELAVVAAPVRRYTLQAAYLVTTGAATTGAATAGAATALNKLMAAYR